MKAKYIALLACAFSLGMTACEEDLDSESIFDNETKIENDFDKWLKRNYVDTYNIEFKYRYEDKESNHDYNLVPAIYENSIALAKLTKYLWLDVYNEVAGPEFIKTYCPKVVNVIGSPAYNSQGSIVLGTAEGGVKITLYNVNRLDYLFYQEEGMTAEDSAKEKAEKIEFLNYWFFKTMHHEFAHILHQTKSYSTDFNLITPSDYQSSSWVNIKDQQALEMGFITPYATNELQEDFVETLSNYVTHNQAWWNDNMAKAGKDGAAKIEQKLEIVRDYLKTSWNIDLDYLRETVLSKYDSVDELDLTGLND